MRPDSTVVGETDVGSSISSGNPLTARLNPGNYKPTVAESRGDLTYVLNRGTGIPCVTTTKIVTTHPGLTRCQVAHDVYSANGKTLLVERGSTIIGEQTSALTHGQARVFALWNTLETPEGIRVTPGQSRRRFARRIRASCQSELSLLAAVRRCHHDQHDWRHRQRIQ